MQIADVNVLPYAINEQAHHHFAAKKWLEQTLNGATTVGFPWVVLLAFLRLSTHPAIAAQLGAGHRILEGWLSRPNAVIAAPSPRHLGMVRGLLEEVGTAGNLVNDAHLAALALEHHAEIVSFDGDFDRFHGVRRVLPRE